MVGIMTWPRSSDGRAKDPAVMAKIARQNMAARGLPLCVMVSALIAMMPWHPLRRIVWNLTKSAPVGLYREQAGGRAQRGQWILAALPIPVERWAVKRGYIGRGVPLLKRLAATTGDRVCAIGSVISINGHAEAVRRETDRAGRPLPHWSGCRRLTDGQIFLLNASSADSFDSRYFGPISRSQERGAVTPVWIVR